MTNLCENRKNNCKITAQTWHQIMGPKTKYLKLDI